MVLNLSPDMVEGGLGVLLIRNPWLENQELEVTLFIGLLLRSQ